MTPPALHRISGMTKNILAFENSVCRRGQRPVGCFSHDSGTGGACIVGVDGVLERSGHQDVALQCERFAMVHMFALGEPLHMTDEGLHVNQL